MNINLGSNIDCVIQTIDRLESYENQYDIFTEVSNFGKQFGFKHTTIGQMAHEALRKTEYADLVISDYPADFQFYYASQNSILHDPVIRHAFVSQGGFNWDNALYNLTHRAKQVVGESADAGLKTGFAVPVHIHAGPTGIVSLGGSNYDLSPDDERALELVTVHSYARLIELKEPSKTSASHTITPREVEVLTYLASGMTNKEIANQLNISAEMTKEHLQHARHKLNAKNRAHAVMLAIQGGVIKL